MCGRFALSLDHAHIRAVPGHDGVEVDEWIDEDAFVPRYNIAPRTNAPILRCNNSSGYVLHTMKWGLIPHWSKYEDQSLNTFNARAEKLVSLGGMWASIKGRKRCAILAQGYYEWLTRGKDKIAHFTKHADGTLMLMAGLYDLVVLEGHTTPLWTFSIITTAARHDFEWLHSRQPVILSTRAALDAWLDTSSQCWTPQLSKLVQPFSDATHPLQCYQVPKEIGKVGSESSAFIEPITGREDDLPAICLTPAVNPTSSSAEHLCTITVRDIPPTTKAKTKPSLVSGSSQRPIEIGVASPLQLTGFPRYSSLAHETAGYLSASQEHLFEYITRSRMDSNKRSQCKDWVRGSLLFPYLVTYLYDTMDDLQSATLQASAIAWKEWDVPVALSRYEETSETLRSFIGDFAPDVIWDIVALNVDLVCVRLHGIIKDIVEYRRL
ncbi:hypothetical protein C0991_011709, partial [Blastosporella zonata]